MTWAALLLICMRKPVTVSQSVSWKNCGLPKEREQAPIMFKDNYAR